MWTTHEKHTKRGETLGNANQNKTTKHSELKELYETTKHLELKELYEMLDKTKTLTTIAR